MHPFPLPQVIDAHLHEIRSLVSALCPDIRADTPDADVIAIAYPGLHDAHQRFDPAASTSFWSYAVHRVRGAIIDEHEALARATRGRRATREAVETWREPESPSPEAMFAQQEMQHLVRREVEQLPTRERHVVRGFYLEERCMDDLAAQLGGMSRSWISRIHTRGIAMLRERMTR